MANRDQNGDYLLLLTKGRYAASAQIYKDLSPLAANHIKFL